jgi:hypothetical protein
MKAINGLAVSENEAHMIRAIEPNLRKDKRQMR